MATLAFQLAGSAMGNAIGGSFGAAIGSALGGTLGSMVDRALIGTQKITREGPRLTNTSGISAQEGAPVPRVYGRVRVGGQVIWATEFEEQRQVAASGGGKSLGGGSSAKVTQTSYAYYANVAIALCEGPVHAVGRIWADGEEIDQTLFTLRVYLGTEDQQPDPLIVAKQGTSTLPGFRGMVYAVFERFPLERYGNRLPQFSFEIIRAAPGLPEGIRAINLIPGSTEFGYSVKEVREDYGYGNSAPINRAQLTHGSDWEASLDHLQALAPNLERVTLINSWFGDDLRVGACTVRPKVERQNKTILGTPWACAGLTRATAQAVSQIEGRACYGGSPSDHSVVEAIVDLKARGLKVALQPFILMDILASNSLPDPYRAGGAVGQSAFPWRGRITVAPAPGLAGSPEGTPAVAAQITPFIGTANAGHFGLSGTTVVYSGPAEWSLRRMVLHQAMLAKAAGGVDTFIMGSEMVGLTHLHAGNGVFPFVDAMVGMLADLRIILGPSTIITYAADWTEYGAYVRNNGAELRFPLDKLWGDPRIGAIGIDFYAPLADWRAGREHADAKIARNALDQAYLVARIEGGEGYDFYYANDTARAQQLRQPISDSAYGKAWTYRPKDLRNWWRNAHYERVNGIELGTPTAFIAQGKPIYLTEIGCGAIDKGANAPNIFPDTKSSEGGLPNFSTGDRDDLQQRRVLEAFLQRFDADHPLFEPAHNPVSTVYGGRMVDTSFIAPWAWDARPYPAFPRLTQLWSDGVNWHGGHWLNGRLESAPLDSLFAMILADFGLEPAQFEGVDAFLDGYIIDRPMSARAALEPLANLFGVIVHSRAGQVRVSGAPLAPVIGIDAEDLVPLGGDVVLDITRKHPSELPGQITLGFVASESDFAPATALASMGIHGSKREAVEVAPFHLPRVLAQPLVETRLQEIWNSQEIWRFGLRKAHIGLEIGDVLGVETGGETRLIQLTRLTDQLYRECEARSYTPGLAEGVPIPRAETGSPTLPFTPSAAYLRALELPLVRGETLVQAALAAQPWGGPYRILRVGSSGFDVLGSVGSAAMIGQTLTPLGPGERWRWQHGVTLDVAFQNFSLGSQSLQAVLAGQNALALMDAQGRCEIILAAEITLLGGGQYRLSRLLRGVGLSERYSNRVLPAGSCVVVLDSAVADLDIGLSRINIEETLTMDSTATRAQALSGLAATVMVRGEALIPLSPVHARARRESTGVRFTFIRRTRTDGDSFEGVEVPLGEEREAYRFEVLKNGVSVLTQTLDTPSYLLPTATETTLFGAAQSVFALRIRQISARMGPGDAFEGSAPVL